MASPSSAPSILHHESEINSSEYPNPLLLNSSTSLPVRSSGLGMSCFTMTFGAISNITALGILAKSRVRFRRQAKAPFLLLAGALLLADLGGHVIPGAFAMYVHMDHSQRYKVAMHAIEPAKTFCQIFGASMVFFGLCPLLLGCAMAVERCVGITQPLLHAATITVTLVRRVVLLLSSLALLLAALPLFAVGTYAPQFPGTWCFLPLHGPRSTADTNLALAFSCLGLTALTLSLLCNIISGLALLQARVSSQNVKPKSAARCHRHASSSSSSSSSSFCSLDVEMMAQLAVITVVSCVCWSPFLIHILVSVMQFYQSSSASVPQPEGLTLLGLRMASWNQILDPWVYILLRRAVLYRVCCALHTEGSTTAAGSSCADSRRQIPSLH
uniref:prostaglandin E receptor 1c (subtype EP1) n=1 Tax=Centroberyx gerrardi TaxID=166262 RepID=UPI003AAB266F